MTLNARCASGARSPLAPTEPFSGTTGCTRRLSISQSNSMTSQADSAEPEREHVRPEQHHCADFRFRKWPANSAGVTTDEVQLKLAQFIRWHSNIGQLAETSVDPVNHHISRHDLLDQLARRRNARARQRRDCDVLATNCDVRDLLQGERLTVQLHLRSLTTIVEARKAPWAPRAFTALKSVRLSLRTGRRFHKN